MMTIKDAAEEIQPSGYISVESGKLKGRLPDLGRPQLAPALAVLRENRDAGKAYVLAVGRGIPYAARKAAQLNELVREHGAIREPGHITATTFADGLSKTTSGAGRINRNEEKRESRKERSKT